jgi:ferredoxin-nitrate reductase
MGLVADRSRALLEEPGGWGRIGFYTTGQRFLEEYYTLGVIGKAGIGTPHMDGNAVRRSDRKGTSTPATQFSAGPA